MAKSRLGAGLFITALLAWGSSSPGQEPADRPRLAVMALDQSPETQSLADLLGVEMKKDADILERAELDRVLAEQHLSAAGLAGGQGGRMAAGKLLRADGFLFVGKIAGGRRLSVRLVETRYGCQVSQMLCKTNGQDLAAQVTHIAPAIVRKIPLLRAPDDQRILVGVLRVGNGTLDPQAGWIEEEAPLFLSACLSAHPAVLTLERRELGHLLDETLLTTGDPNRLRTADCLIDANVFPAAGEMMTNADRRVSVVLRARDAGLNERFRLERTGPLSELEQALAGMAEELMGRLAEFRPNGELLPKAEPELLLSLRRSQGFWAVQAAYALDATNAAVNRAYIEGLIHKGSAYLGSDSPTQRRRDALENARALARAVDLIVSTGQREPLRSYFRVQQNGVLEREFRSDPEIVELLRPFRALMRLEMEREMLPRGQLDGYLFSRIYSLFESDSEAILYVAALLQRVATDPTLTPLEREARTSLILWHFDEPTDFKIILPPAVFKELCANPDPVVRFFAHARVAGLSPTLSDRETHWREAAPLLDGVFNQPALIKRQATASLASTGPGHTYVFRDVLEGLAGSGPEARRLVREVLAQRFTQWIEAGDLTTLTDSLAPQFFPLMDPSTVGSLIDQVHQARQKEKVRLPTSTFGLKTLEDLEEAWRQREKDRASSIPMKPGTRLVLLSPQDERWKAAGGDVFWKSGSMALTPQRLLLEGDVLWVALSGYTVGYAYSNGVNRFVFTARTGLLQLDLATGRILSYRLDSRLKPMTGGLSSEEHFVLSPISAWRDSLVFAENGVGVHQVPRKSRPREDGFKGARRIGLEDGLPTLNLTGASGLGDTLYVILPTLLLAFPDGKGPPKTLAVAGSDLTGGPLDGGGAIIGLAADEAKGHLYVITDGAPHPEKLACIWRYSPADGSFTRVPRESTNKATLAYCRNVMGVEKGMFTLASRKLGDCEHGFMLVRSLFRMDGETLTPPSPWSVPPDTYWARYDCVPYRGGVVAIGGKGMDWELACFLGAETSAVETLAWAMNKPSRAAVSTTAVAPDTDALIAAMASPEPGTRLRAAEKLMESHDPLALWAWIRLLQDPDREVRYQMAKRLGGGARQIPLDVLFALLKDEDSRTADRAASALWSLADPRSADPLMKAMDYWLETNRVRGCDNERCLGYTVSEIAQAMGTLNDKRMLAPLKLALKMNCPVGREGAVYAIGRIETPETVNLLSSMLDDKEWKVQWAALHSLSELRDPRALPLLEAQHQAATDAEKRRHIGTLLDKRRKLE